jgi:hypothetical protein
LEKESPNTESPLPLVIHLLCIVAGTGIVVLIVLAIQLGQGGLRDIINGTSEIPPNHTFHNTEYGYQLNLHGNSWREEKVGTYSNGDALVEYTGLNRDAGVMIFVQNDIEDITNNTQWRIEESLKDISNASCYESRKLLPGSLYLVIYIECEGQQNRNLSINVYQFLQTSDKSFIEFHGHFSAKKSTYTEKLDSLIKTIKSLAPAELVLDETK